MIEWLFVPEPASIINKSSDLHCVCLHHKVTKYLKTKDNSPQSHFSVFGEIFRGLF